MGELMLAEKMFAFALMGSEWVLWLLVLMSAMCIAIAIERALFLRQQSTPLNSLQNALTKYLGGGELTDFSKSLADLKGMEASILQAGLEASEKGGASSAEDTIAGHMVFEKNRLDRGLIIIGTTGSNAPFIGLFGTVLGIIKAFNDLKLKTEEAAASVMAGISEALVATAIGLLVAIPAVILYNYFKQKNKDKMANIRSISHLILSRMKENSNGL
jgi:biopolymer transport protein ExbB